MMYRANAQRTAEYLGALPATFYQVAWTFETQGNLFSSPVVKDDFVCFGHRDKHLYCLDAISGEEHWRFATNGGISCSPAVNDQTIYIGSEDRWLYAVDLASGVERWKMNLGHAIGSSPVITHGSIYIGSGGTRSGLAGRGGHVHALTLSTGEERWRFTASEFGFRSSPAVDADTVYCGNRDGALYAIEAVSGSLRWRVRLGPELVATPVVYQDLVYVASTDAHLYAVATSSGTIVWRFKTGRTLLDASPAVTEDLLVLNGHDGNLYALDRRTGAVKWQVFKSSAGEAATFGLPSIAGEMVLCGCSDGKLYGFAQQSGEELWHLPIPNRVWTSIVCHDGMLYCGGDGKRLYALRTGEKRDGAIRQSKEK